VKLVELLKLFIEGFHLGKRDGISLFFSENTLKGAKEGPTFNRTASGATGRPEIKLARQKNQ